ncbi:hypothetical protein Tco_0918785 [Tanacetum coccineum]
MEDDYKPVVQMQEGSTYLHEVIKNGESLGKVEEVKEINENDNVLNENEKVVENNMLNNVNVLSDNNTPCVRNRASWSDKLDDDSMILSEYESFTFDDEPVMAEVNVFDEINTSELSYPGIGENVVSDEEEDTFTFTTQIFLPFVTYPEVLPVSYSTGSEDKVFKPGIFDNDAFKDKSSKELAPSKALLTLNVFDPLHPPLMDFNVTKAFSGFSGFWKLHGSKLWKDKAIPTISIDGLQSSLHKMGNLLSLSLSN